MKHYPIHETFHSWQGEGAHLGRSSFFIRLYGCPIHCPWCDSAGTWHPDYIPTNIDKLDTDELVKRAVASKAEIVIITGGEPAIHDLHELVSGLRDAGLPSHLETSGAFQISGDLDWITLSPKWQALPLQENIERASEFKIIVEDRDSIDKWIQQIGFENLRGRPTWLQPEWSQSSNPEVLHSITEAVKKRGAPLRAGFQAHKFYKADLEDPGHRKPVPLGGREELGE